jgi:uncharacterized protein (DUF433 family)
MVKHIPLGPIAQEVERRASRLNRRAREQIGKVERHKFVVHNADVISGTRIPVAAVESYIQADYSDRAIMAEYPTLTVRYVYLSATVISI